MEDASVPRVRLVDAQLDDWARLWVWRNEELTRANSRSAEGIPIHKHWEWLKSVLEHDSTRLYIALDIDRGVAIGTGRLDRHDSTVELSLTVDERERGRGYARAIISGLLDQAKAWNGTTMATATVKTSNVASLRAFAAMRFHPDTAASKGDADFVSLICPVAAQHPAGASPAVSEKGGAR